jgi:predicted RNA-binding Zn ribbon-like protein
LRGGHAVLDFVNTVSWRLDLRQREDHLRGYDDLLRWAARADVLTDAEAQVLREGRHAPTASAALDTALALREALHAVLAAPPGSAGDREQVRAAYEAAVHVSRLVPGENGWAWGADRMTRLTPVHRLAMAAVDLMTDRTRPAVRQCADEACGWLFLDRSRQGNRRWCSAADCGNRNRVRRHYHRQREGRVDGGSSGRRDRSEDLTPRAL